MEQKPEANVQHKIRDYGMANSRARVMEQAGASEPARGVVLSAAEYMRVTSEAYARGMLDAEKRLHAMLHGGRPNLIDAAPIWFELAHAIARGAGDE